MTEQPETVRLRWLERHGVRYIAIADLDAWLESHVADFEDDPSKGCAATMQAVRGGLLQFMDQIERLQQIPGEEA